MKVRLDHHPNYWEKKNVPNHHYFHYFLQSGLVRCWTEALVLTYALFAHQAASFDALRVKLMPAIAFAMGRV